jgi:ABC-type antimicrobial peptide transport system permease subunit
VTVAIVADEPPREIVGVVGDTPVTRWDRQAAPGLYIPQLQESLRSRTPYGQSRVQMTFALRITQSPDVVTPLVRRAVVEIDPSLPVSHVEMLDATLARQIQMPRDSMVLLTVFSMVALLLAAVGIYAVVAFGVAQRTKEIAIRVTLGAPRARVLRLVLGRSAFLTAAGILLGLAGAAALTRYLENLLFELTPLDVWTFASVPGVFVLIAAAASYLPARRAAKLEPLAALRFE